MSPDELNQYLIEYCREEIRNLGEAEDLAALLGIDDAENLRNLDHILLVKSVQGCAELIRIGIIDYDTLLDIFLLLYPEEDEYEIYDKFTYLYQQLISNN